MPGNKYHYKTRPYEHQVLALKKLLRNGWGGALLMEPRTGKTKTVIDYISVLHQLGRVERVLIFCPVSVMGVWKHEFETHCPFPYQLIVWDREVRKNYPRIARRTDGKLQVVVTNYDSLSTPGRAYVNKQGNKTRSKSVGGRYDVMKSLWAWGPHLIALDESHRIKSPTARKSKMIHKLGEIADYRVIMTGTVVTKKKRVFDIWSQWQFLNPSRFDDMNFRDFKAHFGRWIALNGYQKWLGNQNLRELHKRIHSDAFAVKREDCFDLPPRLPSEIIRVPLTDSAKAYDDMATEMVHQIKTGEITEASLPIVQLVRLRQITSGVARTNPTPEHPNGRLYRVGGEKLEVFQDLLVDLIENDEKVVVGAQFIHDIESIQSVCDKLKVPCYPLYGKISRSDRDLNIKRFREHTDGCAVFVMQPAAGSLGIDLSTAGTFIWFSLTLSYVDFSQAEDRIALNKQTKGTRFVYLLAQGTVDEVAYNTLMGDGDVAKAIMQSPESILRRG
jgi:SNF2 family DNA or RNA helicase